MRPRPQQLSPRAREQAHPPSMAGRRPGGRCDESSAAVGGFSNPNYPQFLRSRPSRCVNPGAHAPEDGDFPNTADPYADPRHTIGGEDGKVDVQL
jgi:hypothetical protein